MTLTVNLWFVLVSVYLMVAQAMAFSMKDDFQSKKYTVVGLVAGWPLTVPFAVAFLVRDAVVLRWRDHKWT